MITIDDNLARLNVVLAEYMRHTSKSVSDAMAKQGTKIAFALSSRLAAEKPGKGAVRSERLAALSAGGGIKLRASVRNWFPAGSRSDLKRRKVGFGRSVSGTKRVRGKRLNLQALRVKKELGLRERGGGFMAFAARINAGKLRSSKKVTKRGRYHQQLAEAGLMFSGDGAGLQVVYGGPQSEFGGTLNRPKFRRHVNNAIAEVADDMQTYIDRKQREAGNG